MDTRESLNNLGSSTCPACNNKKQVKQCFCRPCYFKLPVPMRTALYKRVGFGFEEAYTEALRSLEGSGAKSLFA
jgi:hypothetical protein